MALSDAAPTPQSKQKLVAIVSRIFEILKEGSQESINLTSNGPVKLVIMHPKGRKEEVDISNLQELADMLMKASEFNASVEVGPDPIVLRFMYSDAKNYGRGMEARVEAPFRESMDKFIAGFILLKDVLTSKLIFDKVNSRATRLKDLVKTVSKKFLGSAYSEEFREIRTHQFRGDRVYFNIFGFIFSIRTRWED